MRDFYLFNLSQESDTTNTILSLQKLTIPAVIHESESLIILPKKKIRLIEPDTQKLVPRVVFRPAPPLQLSESDSLALNLKGGDSVYTDWNLSVDKQMIFDSEAYSAAWDLGDFDTDSIETNSADGLYVEPIVHSTPKKTEISHPGAERTNNVVTEKPLIRQDWFVAILLFLVLITGLVRMNWFRYLKDVMLTIFYPSFTSKLGESNASNFFPSLILGALFYFNISIFTFEILTIYNKDFLGFEGPVMIPVILALFVVLFSAKILVYRIISHIFDTQKSTHSYLASSSATSKAYGILLLAFIVLIPFVEFNIQEFLIKIGIGLFIALYLIQLTNGIRSNFSKPFSGYYIILYLCALEVLPLAVLIKVLFK